MCVRVLNDPSTSDTRKVDVKFIMEMLVDVGGAHWDAGGFSDASTTIIHSHYNWKTVARYMNLQCLAARVVRRHVLGYDQMLCCQLIDFVNLH